MRKVDITEKLSFDENPRLVIKGAEYEVNADAETMLEIMGLFGTRSETDAALAAYEKLLSEKDRKRLNKLKLPFKDLLVVIQSAIDLANGGGEEPREE